jgi:hypothetical protein
MFHDREKFHMGKPFFFKVIGYLRAQFPVGEPSVIFFDFSSPGTDMKFINGDRGA